MRGVPAGVEEGDGVKVKQPVITADGPGVITSEVPRFHVAEARWFRVVLDTGEVGYYFEHELRTA